MLRWFTVCIDWLGDMIARWLNQLCGWWCTVPGWPLITAAIGIGALVAAYAIAWSR